MKARSHTNKGENIEAQRLYKNVLLEFPKNMRAQKELALLNKNCSTIQTQIAHDNEVNNIINLYNSGKFLTVIKKAQELLEQSPKTFKVWNILGASAAEKGMENKAIDAYKKCILLNPNYPDAYYNMGNTLHNLNKHDEAVISYKKAVSIKPDYAEAYYNMGLVFRDQGKLDDAIKSYESFILLRPNYADVYNNLGNLFQDLGKLEKSIIAFKKAISIKPDYANAFCNMGISLKNQGNYTCAVKAFKKAILLKPNFAEAYNNMGNALRNQDKLKEAIIAYQKAISIKPDYESARAQKLFQQANICDWNIIKKDKNLIPTLGTKHKFVSPFTMLCIEDFPENNRLRSEVFVKSNYIQKPLPLPTVLTKKNSDRIRIGYFSADFHNHATMCLIAKVFAIHNRQKFEIYAYSYGPDKKDKMREMLIKSVDVFDDVREMTDKDIATLARQDKIDIAVDLKGLTKDQRLGIFAYRAAPIQISYLGYPGTTGTSFIDYIIADRVVLPVDQRRSYSEKIIYLPNTYQPNDNSRVISSKVGTRKNMGLPEKGFVFCCFNNNYKITSVEFDIWMRLLSKVKGSVLWLLKSNKWAEENLKKEAEKRGINKDRLVFAENLPHDEHLARHKHADLFIDTFNVNAHTTASDALWAGLPIVTKPGQSFIARVAASLLKAINLPELITESKKHYEELILDLATDSDKLKKIKDKLANNRMTQPLFNTETYTKNLENAYHQTYQNYSEGRMPETIFANYTNEFPSKIKQKQFSIKDEMWDLFNKGNFFKALELSINCIKKNNIRIEDTPYIKCNLKIAEEHNSRKDKPAAYKVILNLLQKNIVTNDVLNELLNILGEPSKSSLFIFGLGTGRSGSTSLATSLSKIKGSYISHEHPAIIPWHGGLEIVKWHLKRMMSLAKYHSVIGDVSHWWLPYVEFILKQHANALFIVLRRPASKTVKSFLNIKGSGKKYSINHWQNHNGSYYTKNFWDVCYPSYEKNLSIDEAIYKYWTNYYQECYRLSHLFPSNFIVVDLEDTSKDKLISKFLSQKSILGSDTLYFDHKNIGGISDGNQILPIPKFKNRLYFK